MEAETVPSTMVKSTPRFVVQRELGPDGSRDVGAQRSPDTRAKVQRELGPDGSRDRIMGADPAVRDAKVQRELGPDGSRDAETRVPGGVRARPVQRELGPDGSRDDFTDINEGSTGAPTVQRELGPDGSRDFSKVALPKPTPPCRGSSGPMEAETGSLRLAIGRRQDRAEGARARWKPRHYWSRRNERRSRQCRGSSGPMEAETPVPRLAAESNEPSAEGARARWKPRPASRSEHCMQR